LTQQGFQTTFEAVHRVALPGAGIRAITGAHVTGVEAGVVYYEQLDGSISSLFFDFAMLLPPFRGVDLN
jgi:sulfide:quinone oxidoreductase